MIRTRSGENKRNWLAVGTPKDFTRAAPPHSKMIRFDLLPLHTASGGWTR
jgi:hypothetical protein